MLNDFEDLSFKFLQYLCMASTNISTSFLRGSNTFCRHHGCIKLSVSCWIWYSNNSTDKRGSFSFFRWKSLYLCKEPNTGGKRMPRYKQFSWCISRYHRALDNFCVNFSPIDPTLSRLHPAFRSSNFPVTERFHSKLLLESPLYQTYQLYHYIVFDHHLKFPLQGQQLWLEEFSHDLPPSAQKPQFE